MSLLHRRRREARVGTRLLRHHDRLGRLQRRRNDDVEGGDRAGVTGCLRDEAIQSIATQLKLSLLAPGQQDQSVQQFADKSQYPRMLFESGTVKLFPKLTKTSTTAVSIQDAIPIAVALARSDGNSS